MRESGVVDPQVLVPPFRLPGKELAGVAAIDEQPARALGDDQRAAEQQWGRSTICSPRALPLLVADVWRLLSLDFVEGLCSLAVGMASAGARASCGAMEAAVRGRERRQQRSTELIQFRLIWDVLTDRSAAWYTCVEIMACDRAATGVAWQAVEVEGVVCRRRLDSARPRNGIACARVAIGGFDSKWGVRPVSVYSLWLSTGQAQGRAVFPMHPPHTPIVSVHGSDRYIVYLECPQVFGRRQSAAGTAFFDAFVCYDAGWESTQGFYHTN